MCCEVDKSQKYDAKWKEARTKDYTAFMCPKYPGMTTLKRPKANSSRLTLGAGVDIACKRLEGI